VKEGNVFSLAFHAFLKVVSCRPKFEPHALRTTLSLSGIFRSTEHTHNNTGTIRIDKEDTRHHGSNVTDYLVELQ